MSTILILGGTSAVAMAYARKAALDGHNLHLVGRNKVALSANAADLDARGTGTVAMTVLDLGMPADVELGWDKVIAATPEIDHVLLAYGVLGEQSETQNDRAALARNLDTNFSSAALWSEVAFQHFQTTGTGQITVIGSVAGDRGRQSNYHYGAAKGALDIFVSGMAHRSAKTVEANIGITLVKPGFIDTPMTDGMDKSGPLWASPEKVAAIIRKAERKRRTKIYAPWFWRYILLVIRTLPFPIFKRTSL
jgi:short-subunit dehydrogenase